MNSFFSRTQTSSLLEEARNKDRLKLSVVNTSCKQGCNWCCHYPKVVPFLEALSMVTPWVDGSVPVPSMFDLKERAKMDLRTVPMIHLLSKTPCHFLSEGGDCSIYSLRPSICSSHYVTSDPNLCDPHLIYSPTPPVRVETPATDKVAEKLVSEGRAMGYKYPSLPISVAYYMAYKSRVEGWSVDRTNYEVSLVLGSK